MTATLDFTVPAPTPSAESLTDPLAPFQTPSRNAQRVQEVALLAYEISEAAREAGWTITGDIPYSKGRSRYLQMHLSNSVAVTVRVADHAPGRPIGCRGDRPTILATLGCPGCSTHAIRWLQRTAEEVGRVLTGGQHAARLPKPAPQVFSDAG